jgi:hypothetical protein
MSRLEGGVARADITPPAGIAHANWGAQSHQSARGIDLPLWATALALGDGEDVVVVVDIDQIYLWGDVAVAAREAVAELTGLPFSNIRLSYTHTHSGPSDSAWIEEGRAIFSSYRGSLPHRIAGAAWEAVRTMRPARMEAAIGSCGIAVNRRFPRPEDGAVVVGRNWDGPVDPEVQLLRIDAVDGQPLAAVVNYACHPITVGWDNDLITPDYPGAMKRVVERSTGATCLFLQGAAGNVGPVRGVARNGLGEYRRLGAILGHEASRLWWETEVPLRQERYLSTLESGAPHAVYADEPIEEASGPSNLKVGSRTMRLPLRSDLPAAEEAEAEAEAAARRLNDMRVQGAAEDELQHQTMVARRASIRASVARGVAGETHETFEAQAFVVGKETALLAMPGEPFVEIGLEVKRRSPFARTLFSGYSNVGWAYIPVREAYEEGGYEVEFTPFAPEAAETVMQECVALLEELAG